MLVHNGWSMLPTSLDADRPAPLPRMDAIAHARRVILHEGADITCASVAPWIERSWRRCMQWGLKPHDRVSFDAVSASTMRRARDDNTRLTRAATASMQALGQTLARTRYFAILTNAQGLVIDVAGPIDRSDRRASLITRIGVDLSEHSVGTTAIGAVLAERQPVWLHRGEHFFQDTTVYSCAGAPLFGHDGACVGMLDLTGVDVPERPELLHLAVQSARGIENALALAQPHAILLRLNWPGQPLGGDTDALVGIDGDGIVSTSNRAARAMVPQLGSSAGMRTGHMHAAELFALPTDMLFDAARRDPAPLDLPLWSGLRLQALVLNGGAGAAIPAQAVAARIAPAVPAPGRLRDIETELIQRAVRESGGNVAQAASRLGVSRATVYRKLGSRKR